MNRFSAAFNTLLNYNSPIQKWGNDYFTQMGFNFGTNNLSTLIEDGFKSNTHIYSIINRICEAGADIPVLIEAIQPNGDVVIVDPKNEDFAKYRDYYEFVHNPNKNNNYKSFMYAALVYQLTTGNVIQLGINPTSLGGTNLGGVFLERYNLQPQYIQPVVTHNVWGPEVKEYQYSPNGGNWTLEPEKIMHLRRFNPDPQGENDFMGMSPLSAAFRTMVTDNENVTAQASLLKNKGVLGFLTNRGKRSLTPTEKDAMDKALNKRIGGATEFGGVRVTSGDVDFVKMSMSPSDLKLLEMGTVTLRDLCSVYGVNSRMFNDPKGTTFNNAREDQKNFYNNAVIPPVENELDHFNRFYNPGWNERDGVTYVVKPDVSSIDALQEDKTTSVKRAQTKSTIITNILGGIGTKWTETSALNQLMFTLHMTETEAKNLIDKQVEQPTQPTQPTND